jgi:hypothetical protein
LSFVLTWLLDLVLFVDALSATHHLPSAVLDYAIPALADEEVPGPKGWL